MILHCILSAAFEVGYSYWFGFHSVLLNMHVNVVKYWKLMTCSNYHFIAIYHCSSSHDNMLLFYHSGHTISHAATRIFRMEYLWTPLHCTLGPCLTNLLMHIHCLTSFLFVLLNGAFFSGTCMLNYVWPWYICAVCFMLILCTTLDCIIWFVRCDEKGIPLPMYVMG